MVLKTRSAFTLVELLVVIGLMGMLATVSVAGYNAASRGMADRGAIQDVVSALRLAKQTCQIDRVPVKVMFFNRRLREASGEDDDFSVYSGEMRIIKRSGRISLIKNNILLDEFADWHLSYPRVNSTGSSRGGMRLYNMGPSIPGNAGLEQCSTLVNPYVERIAMDDYMIFAGRRISEWCSDNKRTENDNKSQSASVPSMANNWFYGFAQSSASGSGLPVGSWKTGDPYGVEIASFQLPTRYIFGNTLPSSIQRVSALTSITFDPDKVEPTMSGNVVISRLKANASGELTPSPLPAINSSMLEDNNN